MPQPQIIKVNDIISVDEGLGLVFGYAIVCKVRNDETGEFEDYYDLNIDADGVHKGERVPEHITEEAMLDCSFDMAKAEVVPGNEMHAGPDVGRHIFLLPVTEDMAKSLDWVVKRTGLVVGYYPNDPDVLAKFKSGEYTGFSIEGARIEYIEEEA